MQFGSPPVRKRLDSIVPMINVVFLLLIFFLMSATIAPQPPFDLNLPESRAAASGERADTLYLDAGGLAAYGGATGDAAFQLLARRPGDQPLEIRADAALAANALAAILPRLAALGVRETRLITVGGR